MSPGILNVPKEAMSTLAGNCCCRQVHARHRVCHSELAEQKPTEIHSVVHKIVSSKFSVLTSFISAVGVLISARWLTSPCLWESVGYLFWHNGSCVWRKWEHETHQSLLDAQLPLCIVLAKAQWLLEHLDPRLVLFWPAIEVLNLRLSSEID